MDKIGFDFFCQLLKENLCYAEISEILKKKLPERWRIFRAFHQELFEKKMVYLQEFLKTISMKWSLLKR